MRFIKSRRFYIIILISLIISLTMVLPMILGMMGYDIFNRRLVPVPSKEISFWKLAWQWLLYFLMVGILMTINTIRKPGVYGWHKILASIIVIVICYFIFSLFRPPLPVPEQRKMTPAVADTGIEQTAPPLPPRHEAMPPDMPVIKSFGPDYRRMTEFLFILLITTLLGKVFELFEAKQQMQLENEQLRSENLQNSYNVLLNQINPHFFFNSLNSLSSLVRDGRNENALRYIDELSNTYRYAIQSSGKELVTVAEELESVYAYSYLLQIRFEDKLFIEVNIDDEAKKMMLPVLSLQPLIENVVKHNVISAESPLTITITGKQKGISVMNPIHQRNISNEKSGTGLDNLATRYKLLTGKELLIIKGKEIFSVTLPLIKPDNA